ncbi:MAG: DUF3055 domain-containing protein [Candidatus Carbobacillus altaicus]|nr:DUF3055 domain-containing protein [Candidatus Carbobacillus altaicus]
MERDFLYDTEEMTKVRYVSFFTEHGRFDLALIRTDRFFGKTLVLDMQKNVFAIIGDDDLEEEHYLEEVFQLTPEEATSLHNFLREVID